MAEVLDNDPWLASIPVACRAQLLAGAQIRVLTDGSVAYRLGDAPSGLMLVVTGEIRLVSYPIAGRHLINLTIAAGHWFGELSTLDGEARPHDAVANGSTTLLHISQCAVARAVDETPEVYRNLVLLACRNQRAGLDYVGLTLGHGSRGRLAQALLRLAPTGPGDSAPATLRIRQEDLAQRVQISRQTLSRLLKDFEHSGLIRCAYGRIEVLDVGGLQALSPL